MYELSGITFCRPAPFGSSFRRIVKVSVEIETTSYSLNSSTGTVPDESEKNEIKSPTLNALPDKSASSTSTVVAPAESSPTVKLEPDNTCSNEVAVAQI